MSCGCGNGQSVTPGIAASGAKAVAEPARYVVYKADGSRVEAGSEQEAKTIITAAGGGSYLRK